MISHMLLGSLVTMLYIMGLAGIGFFVVVSISLLIHT